MIHNLDACIVCCVLDPIYLKPRRFCTANHANINFLLLPSAYLEDKSLEEWRHRHLLPQYKFNIYH